MATDTKHDLGAFYEFVGELLSSGTRLTPDEVLLQWKERLATIASVRRGIEDVNAGRTRPASELIDELRNKSDD